MKYFAFMGIFLAGMGGVAVGSSRSAAFRSLCWTGLVAFIALGDMSGVNFISTESYRGTDRGFELTFTDMFALGLLLSRALAPAGRGPSGRGGLSGSATGAAVRRGKAPPGFFAFAAYIAFAIPGVSGSLEPLYGAFTLWKLLRVLLLYWIVWTGARDEPEPARFYDGVRRGLMLGLLAVGLMGAKQKFADGMYRVNGTFDHSNTIPLYVNLAAAPLLAWILGNGRLKRLEFLAGFFAVGISLVAVLATQSRLGILLAGVSTGGALVVSNIGKVSRRARAAAIVFVMAATVGGFMVMDTLLDRIRNAPESSAQARDEFNVAAMEMAADEPFGVGLNNFPVTMTRVEKYRAHVEVMANEEESGVAHHLYLLTAAETGFAGLALLLVTFMLAALPVLRYAISKKADWNRGYLPPLAMSALFGQAALFTSCFFEWAFRITPVISQYFVVGAIISSAVSRASIAPLAAGAAGAIGAASGPSASRPADPFSRGRATA